MAVLSPPALVSLIMPVWAPHGPWLREAVASALAEHRCRCELLIVDDGCGEPVAALLENAVRDQRLRLIRIDHGGQAAALNAGIAAAQGEWFRFIDADDVVTQGSTSHLLELAREELVVTYGATQVCDENLVPRRTIGSALQGDVIVDCLLGRFHTRHPSMLFPRRVVEAAGPWDTRFRVSADWDFVLRALEHARVRGDHTVATLYRRHTRSVSRRAGIEAGEESRRRMLADYFARHPEQQRSALERRAWGALYRDRAYAYWDAGQYPASLARLAMAIGTEPILGTVDVARFVATRIRRRLAAGAGRTVSAAH